MGKTLSILTIMQDEEEPIRWYLESCAHLAANFSDLKEVVLVDGGSIDRTLEIVHEYETRVPLRVFERPWDFTRAQLNFGLDQCSGDYIFNPDADFTWTTNMPTWLRTGEFATETYWDFPLLFTARDAYHYFTWPPGPSMRMFSANLPGGRRRHYDETRKYHVHLEGQYQGIPVCRQVFMFENSCRITNEIALRHRGQRRQHCAADMELEGSSPGDPDRFLNASKSGDILPFPLEFTHMILPSTNNSPRS